MDPGSSNVTLLHLQLRAIDLLLARPVLWLRVDHGPDGYSGATLLDQHQLNEGQLANEIDELLGENLNT